MLMPQETRVPLGELAGALRSNKGRRMSFKQIREAAAKAAVKCKKDRDKALGRTHSSG